MAFLNAAAIRGNLPNSGSVYRNATLLNVTMGDFKLAFPFQDFMTILQMTGLQVTELLRVSCKNYRNNDFLIVGNIRYSCSGNVLTGVKVYSPAQNSFVFINSIGVYSVATIDFISLGYSSTYPVFKTTKFPNELTSYTFLGIMKVYWARIAPNGVLTLPPIYGEVARQGKATLCYSAGAAVMNDPDPKAFCNIANVSGTAFVPITVCPPGHFSVASASLCLPCAPGSYSATSIGSSFCSFCGAGTFSAQPGARECLPCPSPTYSGLPGQSACIACAVGSFSNSSGVSACGLCPLGTFSESSGQRRCASCSPGFYTLGAGAVTCYRCKWPSAVIDNHCQDIVCPAGSQPNPEGNPRQLCDYCPSGSFKASNGSGVCVSCTGNSHAFMQGMR